MNPSTLSFKQASTLLFFFLFLVINVTTRGIEVRGNSCSGGCCAGDDVSDDEVTANEEAVQDGPTSDRSAGLGIEFEASALQFYSNKCSNKDKKLTDKLKGEMVGGRRGTNWKLTVDTSPNTAGSLTAEYILDGLNIKIGSGDAAKAASDVAADLVSTNPSTKESSCCLLKHPYGLRGTHRLHPTLTRSPSNSMMIVKIGKFSDRKWVAMLQASCSVSKPQRQCRSKPSKMFSPRQPQSKPLHSYLVSVPTVE